MPAVNFDGHRMRFRQWELRIKAGFESEFRSERAGGTTNETNTSGENTTDEEMKPEAGAKLMVWEAKEQLEYMKQVAADFEKEYGVPVTVEEMAGGDQGARLATDGPSKLAADVLTLPHDQIGQAVKAGLLLPNDVFEEETKSTMVATAVQASSYDGILYGYPKSVETYALFYNKDLIPDAPKTWDDVIAFADTYNNPKENKFAIMWEFVGYYSYPFIGSFGDIFTETTIRISRILD